MWIGCSKPEIQVKKEAEDLEMQTYWQRRAKNKKNKTKKVYTLGKIAACGTVAGHLSSEEMEEAEVDIDTLVDEMDYIPGHFHLNMNLNFESSSPLNFQGRDVKLKRESLTYELELETGSQQLAIRNLLGVFSFYLEEVEQAKEIFLHISQEAPENLNAWANLAYVYDRLNNEHEEACCTEKLSHLMGLDSGDDPEGNSQLRAARCLAEQGYAYAFDVGLVNEDEKLEKLMAGLALYAKALAYGKQVSRQA